MANTCVISAPMDTAASLASSRHSFISWSWNSPITTPSRLGTLADTVSPACEIRQPIAAPRVRPTAHCQSVSSGLISRISVSALARPHTDRAILAAPLQI